MVVSLLEDAIVVYEVQDLVGLDILRDALLALNELIERLELLGHVIDSVIYDLFYLHEFMISTRAPGCGVGLAGVFSEAEVAERELMSAAILADFLVVRSAYREWNILRHARHRVGVPERSMHYPMIINGIRENFKLLYLKSFT